MSVVAGMIRMWWQPNAARPQPRGADVGVGARCIGHEARRHGGITAFRDIASSRAHLSHLLTSRGIIGAMLRHWRDGAPKPTLHRTYCRGRSWRPEHALPSQVSRPARSRLYAAGIPDLTFYRLPPTRIPAPDRWFEDVGGSIRNRPAAAMPGIHSMDEEPNPKQPPALKGSRTGLCARANARYRPTR